MCRAKVGGSITCFNGGAAERPRTTHPGAVRADPSGRNYHESQGRRRMWTLNVQVVLRCKKTVYRRSRGVDLRNKVSTTIRRNGDDSRSRYRGIATTTKVPSSWSDKPGRMLAVGSLRGPQLNSISNFRGLLPLGTIDIEYGETRPSRTLSIYFSFRWISFIREVTRRSWRTSWGT